MYVLKWMFTQALDLVVTVRVVVAVGIEQVEAALLKFALYRKLPCTCIDDHRQCCSSLLMRHRCLFFQA